MRGAAATVRPSGTGAGQGPTHYGSAVINGLFTDGPGQYLVLTGRSPSGFILSQFTRTGTTPGYDAYRGVYDTVHAQNAGFSILYEQSNTNVFVLPRPNTPTTAHTSSNVPSLLFIR